MSGARDTSTGALRDREEIRELAVRYAHCVWTKDVAALAGLFTDDGVMDTGSGDPLRGRDAVRDTYARVFARDDYFPFVHNHVIDLSGDEARGTCYLDLRAVVDGTRMTGFGTYDDWYVRTRDGWRFLSRTLSMTEFRPSPE
jgi:ketosteroid isomerase-like protein